MTIWNYFLWFVIYCFIGWIYESTYCSIKERHWVDRGFLNGPLIPIYGSGAVLAIFLFHDYTSLNAVYLFFLCGLVDCILEYLTSWGMEKLFHARWWDYSKSRFNLNGRVCLLGFSAFGVMSVLLLKWLHPAIAKLTDRIPVRTLHIVDVILAVLILADTAETVHTVLTLNHKLEQIQKALDEEKEKLEKRFDDYKEDMEERFAALSDTVDEIEEKIRDSRHNLDPDSYYAQMAERFERLKTRLAEATEEESEELSERMRKIAELMDNKREDLMEISRLRKERLEEMGRKLKPLKRGRSLIESIQNFMQRRLIVAFPNLKPQNGNEALQSLRHSFDLPAKKGK